jgi:hypothetical protein
MKNIILTLLLLSSLLANAQNPPIWSKVKLASGDSAKMFIIDWRDVGSVMITKPNTTKTIQLEAGRTFFPNAIYLDGFDQTKAHTVEIKITPIGGVVIPPIPSVLGSIDNVDARNKYTGDWTVFNHSAFHNGTSTYTLVNGEVEITFIGKKIEWWTEKADNHGIAGLSIDGGVETMVDLYANTKVNNSQKVWTSPDLLAGEHKLKIRFTGSKNAASREANFIHDRVLVTQ